MVNGVFERVWKGRDVDAYDDYCHEDMVVHVAGYSEPFPNRDAFKNWVRTYQSAFPDISITVKDVLAQGDVVLCSWRSDQTHLGTYLNIRATGKRSTIDALQLFRLSGEKFSEVRIMFDPLHVLQQLGIFPEGPPPRPLIAFLRTLTRLKAMTTRA